MALAARIEDPVQHSNAVSGLVAGALIGVAIGAAIVLTGGAAGLIAVAIIGTSAAAGAGIGEVLGSLSVAGGSVTGGVDSGSADTTYNGRKAARATWDTVDCKDHPEKHIAQGSATVTVNNMLAARMGDKIECGSTIHDGSANVIIGGATVTTLDIQSEVPFAVHVVIAVVGIAGAVVIAGPALAILGTVASFGGGLGGQQLAVTLGLDEDWQKLFGLAGSLIAGWGVGKLAPKMFANSKVAAFDRALMRPALQRLPGYRQQLAGMKGASPTQQEARTQIAGEHAPGTQAAKAASFQGGARYPGQDPMTNVTLQPGERFVAGVDRQGNPSGYFVKESDFNDFIAGGGTRDDFWNGLQVQPSPAHGTPLNPNGFRDSVTTFQVTSPTEAAIGPTVGNTQFGAGGLPQVFTDQFGGNMVSVGSPIALPATPDPVLVNVAPKPAVLNVIPTPSAGTAGAPIGVGGAVAPSADGLTGTSPDRGATGGGP